MRFSKSEEAARGECTRADCDRRQYLPQLEERSVRACVACCCGPPLHRATQIPPLLAHHSNLGVAVEGRCFPALGELSAAANPPPTPPRAVKGRNEKDLRTSLDAKVEVVSWRGGGLMR